MSYQPKVMTDQFTLRVLGDLPAALKFICRRFPVDTVEAKRVLGSPDIIDVKLKGSVDVEVLYSAVDSYGGWLTGRRLHLVNTAVDGRPKPTGK